VQLARLRQEVTDLSEATQHARALQQERQELIAAQERKVREVDAELATMLGHIKELTAEAAAAEDRAHTLQEKVAAWELLGGQKDTDRARLQAELALAHRKLQETNNALAAARADANAHRNASERAVVARSAQATEEQEELAKARAQLKDVSDKLMALTREYLAYKERSEKTIANLTADGAKKDGDAGALAKRVAELEAEGARKDADRATLTTQLKETTDKLKKSTEEGRLRCMHDG